MKACVLIENVLASFEMHEILYALKDHSLGLNCGIWDYSASFINKFGKVYKMYNQQVHYHDKLYDKTWWDLYYHKY